MKKLLIGALMLTSLSSFAQSVENNLVNPVLECYSAEPFISLTYNPRTKILVTDAPSWGDGEVVTQKGVVLTWEGVDEGVPFYSLKNKQGETIMMLYKDGMGEDGMSEETYEYSVEEYGSLISMGCNIVEGN
jgi:uncharacterized membrane protein